MNEKEVGKCPKCSGDMVRGDGLVVHTSLLASVSLAKRGDVLGDIIIPYYCEKCGYIEFYKEMKGVSSEDAFLKRCAKCGKKMSRASEECPFCGEKQNEADEP